MASNSGGDDEDLQPPEAPLQNGSGDTGLIDTPLKLADEQDALRFGSIPRPDYDFWARKSVWTVDQAVALSLAKDPTVISWDVICTAFPDIVWTPCQITDFAKFSRFTNHFRLRRELLFDNIVFGNVGFVEAQFGWVTPIKFVNWIRQHDLWAPGELAEYVQKYLGSLLTGKQKHFASGRKRNCWNPN